MMLSHVMMSVLAAGVFIVKMIRTHASNPATKEGIRREHKQRFHNVIIPEVEVEQQLSSFY